MAQNIPSYVPKDGLVAWWPFNGNTNDESGNSRNLTNNGAELEADRYGNKNKAYLLANGSNLSYTGKSITGGESYTYSFWMKTNKNLNEYQDFIFRENGTNETGHETGVWFFFHPSTKDLGIVNPGNSYAGILRKQFPYTDEWHHVVVQGPREYKVYVDGKLFVTGSSDYKKFADSCIFQIGAFQGSIDDFSVHNRQLSLDEIKAIYTNSVTKTEIPTYLPQDGLVAWYPFNGNTYDESGNSRNLTNNGAELEADRYGNANKAYLLSNGSNLRYRGKSISGGESFTYSFWMKTNKNLNEYQDFIFSENGVNETGHETGVWFFFHPSTKDFGIVNPGNSYAGILRKQFPYIDEWHHVVVQGPSEYKIYVDGKLFETSYSDYKKFADTCTFQIGTFHGSIDDFSVYNRKLSAEEIQTLYSNSAPKKELPKYIPTDGLVGYWPFNGNANDESGNGNHGTVNGATLTTDRNGKANNAYSFDGYKNDIDCGNNSILNLNNFSISVWYKVIEDPKVPSEYTIVSKTDYTNNTLGYRLALGSSPSTKPQLIWSQIGGANSCGDYLDSDNETNKNIWTNVIGVKDQNTLKIYVDGKLQQKITEVCGNFNNSRPLLFGSSYTVNNIKTGFFNGQLDDIAIYNRALTQQEITTLYTGCTSETATSSNFNSLLLSTGSSVSLSAEPQGGVFTGASIDSNKFVPSKAKIGANKVQYNFKNSQGCNDSTLFTMIVADTVGTTCKKYDTITVKNNVYDTVIIKTNVFDTVKVNTYDTITVKNNVYDTVIINKTKYDTITVTNNVTKYDTVIVKTNVFDTVKVNKYDTITVTNSITKYDTVIVPKTVTKYDTVKVNTYDTITITNNVTKYDTVLVNKYDTITITNNVTKYDTVLVNKYDTITVTDTVSILKIKFKLTTGLQANQLASMSVYPNPTTDVLHIEIGDVKALEGYRYRILDALGKEVYNELVKNTLTEIPLKTLGASGMYQLEVLDANKTSIQTNKIVLQ